MDISVIIPVYNERENLILFYHSLKLTLEEIDKEAEIIFINDASNDGSREILEGIREKDKKIKIINFRKRRGQLIALREGFKKARGDIIITLDCDLQYDVGEIRNFIEKIEQGYDAVSGIRVKRYAPLYRRILSKIANYLIRKITKTKVHDLGCSFNALRKKVYDRIIAECGDKVIITKPLIAKFSRNFTPLEIKQQGSSNLRSDESGLSLTGFTEIKVSHFPRIKGKSKNSLWDLFLLFKTNLRR
jgi:glycosyltransferase involved in cell wall biosynthesis